MAKLGLFDILKHLNEPGGDAALLENEENLKEYAPFMINRAMAQSMSTVMYASELNRKVLVDKAMHYGYLFHSVSKTKRYAKWAKKQEIPDNVELVSRYYNISMDKAAEYCAFLTNEQIESIKESMDTGGQVGRARGKK